MFETVIDLVIGILKRQKWRIGVFLLLCAALSLGVAQMLRPTFSATALIVVEPMSTSAYEGETTAPTLTVPAPTRVDAEVEILRSGPVLERTLDRLDAIRLDDLPPQVSLNPATFAFFRMMPAARPDEADTRSSILRAMRQAITVQRRGLTPIIAITVRSAQPEIAAHLANTMAVTHIDMQLEAKSASVATAHDLVEARIAEAAGRLVVAEAAAADLMANFAAMLPAGETAGDFVRLREALARAESDERQTQAAILRTVEDPAAEAIVLTDLQQRLAADQAIAISLRETLRTQLQAWALPGEAPAALFMAQQQVDLARGQYRLLVERAVELDAEERLQLPYMRIVAAATPPDDASFPNVRLILVVGMGIGLAVVFAVGFYFHGLRRGVRTTSALANAVQAPIALAVPRVDGSRLDGSSHADVMVRAPLSAFSEGVRSLRLMIQRTFTTSGPGQVVVVTSAREGEGKTTTSLALARAFDAAGQRVLLLDADVRSSALHRHLDVPAGAGFERVLSGEVAVSALGELVRRDPLSGVSILLNSDRSALPAERLFGGTTFAGVVRAARASFDVVIVDMPSARWAAELANIVPHANAAVVVARWGCTGEAQLVDVVSMIRAAHPQPLPVLPLLTQFPAQVGWPMRRQDPGYLAG